MDFRRLGYFAQIAELGSLTRTAERLGIAQPSLSRQMRLLEEELGVVLFTRGARGMQLTEAGELLRARIAGPLRQIGHAIYEVRSLSTETGGEVVFGMPPTMILLLAGPLARRVAERAPNITLRIVDGYSGHLLEWLRRGELDGAVLYGPTPAGVNATKLVEDELGLVGPPGSPIQAAGAVEFERLGELPLVLPRPSPGYTALPHFAVSREVEEGRLTFARIVDPPARRQLFLAMQSGSDAPRAVLQVEDLVRQEVAALVEGGRWSGARLFNVGDS